MTPLPEKFLARLADLRWAHRLPAGLRDAPGPFVRELLGLLFPHFAEVGHAGAETLPDDARRAIAAVEHFVSLNASSRERAAEITDAFAARLPAVHEALIEDATATYEADPAARSLDEIILAYPGFLAIAGYRFAHELHRLDVPLLPRLVGEWTHGRTGIDLHPAARIGRGLSIDHGTGIVVGETAVIGDRVRLYQGVTLGAHSVLKDESGAKRHPTIEDDVVLYANATILGGDTVIGARSVIGGNVWLTRSVPPDSVVTEVPNIDRRSGAGIHPSERSRAGRGTKEPL